MAEKKEKKIVDSGWDKIQEANKLIKTIELKGKQYAEVKERVIAFRRVHPLGQIITEMSYTDNYVNCTANIFDENDKLLAKGHAREYLKYDFALERCESSSIGRALGFCGYGISTAIASAEDIQQVDKPSEIFDVPTIDELIRDMNKYFTKQEQVDLLNCVHRVEIKNVPAQLLVAMIEFKKNEKHNSNK